LDNDDTDLKLEKNNIKLEENQEEDELKPNESLKLIDGEVEKKEIKKNKLKRKKTKNLKKFKP